jgi:hypothetical protein
MECIDLSMLWSVSPCRCAESSGLMAPGGWSARACHAHIGHPPCAIRTHNVRYDSFLAPALHWTPLCGRLLPRKPGRVSNVYQVRTGCLAFPGSAAAGEGASADERSMQPCGRCDGQRMALPGLGAFPCCCPWPLLCREGDGAGGDRGWHCRPAGADLMDHRPCRSAGAGVDGAWGPCHDHRGLHHALPTVRRADPAHRRLGHLLDQGSRVKCSVGNGQCRSRCDEGAELVPVAVQERAA